MTSCSRLLPELCVLQYGSDSVPMTSLTPVWLASQTMFVACSEVVTKVFFAQ